MATGDSSSATSEDLKKMIEEQTVVEEEEALEESEEAKEQEEEETPEETSEEETTEKSEPKSKSKKTLHKIKVEGKEEEVDYEKLIEYAQKGRYLEREMAKLRKEKEELLKAGRQTTTPFSSDMDRAKLNREFIEELEKDPLGTLAKFYGMAKQQDAELQRAEKLEDKRFELEMKEQVPHWNDIKPIYQEFRDLGYSREEAFLRAENDYIKSILATAINKGRKEGENKAKNKLKAELPVKEKVAGKNKLPPPEEFSKMSSKEMAKYLRYYKDENW